MEEQTPAGNLLENQAKEKEEIITKGGHTLATTLVVGLGNPGRKHSGHRHNIGFLVIDALAAAHAITLSRRAKKAIMGKGTIGRAPVILAKPQTFMNLSGESVGPLAAYYRIAPENVLVIYDELDLPLGTIRLREKGGAGGHNGMKSIIAHLGTDFPRMRLGIGRPPGQMPPAAYVLQRFSPNEEEIVHEVVRRAVQAVETFVHEGIDLAMSRHNGPLTDIA